MFLRFFSLVVVTSFTYNLRAMTTPQTQTGGTFVDSEEVLITKEGLKKLKDELDYLKTTKRGEIASRLKEAISYGDLSENAEYEEAKNEQAFVEGRILELEKQSKNARIITEHAPSAKATKGAAIDIGSIVTVRNKTDGDEPETYTIVGSMEADPIEHKISNESPIGRALLGREKGDIVDVIAPAGKFKYEVIKVA